MQADLGLLLSANCIRALFACYTSYANDVRWNNTAPIKRLSSVQEKASTNFVESIFQCACTVNGISNQPNYTDICSEMICIILALQRISG